MITKIFRWSLVIIGVILLLIFLALLCFRISSAFRENQSNREAAPASGRFVKASDVEIYLQEAGQPSKQAVLFLHGNGAWSEIWRNSLNAVGQAGFHAIAIDIPPFGFSDKPEGLAYSNSMQAKRILSVLDSLEIEKVILVGHSYSGQATMEAVLSSPERVKALILVDAALPIPSLKGEANPKTPSLFSLFKIKAIRNLVVSATAANPLLTKTLLQSLMANPVTDDQVIMLKKPMVVENSTEKFGNWIMNFLYPEKSLVNNPDLFRKISIPTLLIWGTKDTINPLSQAEFIQSLIPNAELKTIEGAGHIPQLEKTEEFNTILINYLKSI